MHSSAGAAVLGILLVVGRRRDWPRGRPPSSVPLVLLGGGILWFGWFGFNGGDGLQADGIAAQAVLNTHGRRRRRDARLARAGAPAARAATVIGAVSGAVAGLATVTPCAGYVGAPSRPPSGSSPGCSATPRCV